jgi:hypothetical protein
MTIYPMLLISLQVAELLCYLHLYKFIHNHHKQMVHNNVISSDTYKSRKRVHLFSLSAQISGFVVKISPNFICGNYTKKIALVKLKNDPRSQSYKKLSPEKRPNIVLNGELLHFSKKKKHLFCYGQNYKFFIGLIPMFSLSSQRSFFQGFLIES